ncbi:MAG: DUF4149 domain-containing protein [Chitinophagaceae bacterium]|nr:DUF4149 domain-containing protein [Polaromonas sp.]
MRYRFGLMIVALWWGSLTALGFVIVPLLFANLPSTAVAGALAAKLFTAQAWLSVACTMFVLLSLNKKEVEAGDLHAQSAIKFVVAGLLLTVLVEFAVAPRIVSARALGESLKFWHGLGSVMYFGQWLCAGFALWILSLKANTSELV